MVNDFVRAHIALHCLLQCNALIGVYSSNIHVSSAIPNQSDYSLLSGKKPRGNTGGPHPHFSWWPKLNITKSSRYTAYQISYNQNTQKVMNLTNNASYLTHFTFFGSNTHTFYLLRLKTHAFHPLCSIFT